jgi:hypothetical protein
MMFREKSRYGWSAFRNTLVGMVYVLVFALAMAAWFNMIVAMALRAASDCAA